MEVQIFAYSTQGFCDISVAIFFVLIGNSNILIWRLLMINHKQSQSYCIEIYQASPEGVPYLWYNQEELNFDPEGGRIAMFNL